MLFSIFCLGESFCLILSNLKLIVFVYFLSLQKIMGMEQKIGGRLMSSIESVSFSVTSKQCVDISVKDPASWQLNKASPLVLPKTSDLLSWTDRPVKRCRNLNSICLVLVFASILFGLILIIYIYIYIYILYIIYIYIIYYILYIILYIYIIYYACSLVYLV